MTPPEFKKQKTDSDEIFATIGEQAENVENRQTENSSVSQAQADAEAETGVINADELRHTGAYDNEGRPVQELESLCMRCHEQGTTRLLFTKIPSFKEVVIMSFECPHCFFTSNEIQSAAEIQDKGHTLTLKVTEASDLGRQVVKTQYATCKFPDFEIEIPLGSGRVTTIEGILTAMKDDLLHDQPIRESVDRDMYLKVGDFVEKLVDIIEGKKLPFTFILDDPSGNSHIVYSPEDMGSKFTEKSYFRTPTQMRQMGMAVPEGENRRNESMASTIDAVSSATLNNGGEFDESVPEDMREEIQTFHATCPSCNAPTPTHMKMVNIPHFKDVIIMSTVCHSCGYKSNEVKTGGAIPEMGRRIKLDVVEADDLTRDILKSETATMKFPELDLDLQAGTLGGRFTTLEGLLRQVYEELESKIVHRDTDTMDDETKRRWAAFLARLQTAIEGHLPFTLIMEDPLAASYVQNIYAPDEDPNMEINDYKRTAEEEEDLGIADMNV